MADLCVNSTGRIFRRIDDGTALLLMEAFPEAFSHAGKAQTFNVTPDPMSALLPRFCVGVTNSGTGALAIIRKQGNTTEYYSGPAEQVKKQPGWETCPDAVVEQWKRTDARQRAQVRG